MRNPKQLHGRKKYQWSLLLQPTLRQNGPENGCHFHWDLGVCQSPLTSVTHWPNVCSFPAVILERFQGRLVMIDTLYCDMTLKVESLNVTIKVQSGFSWLISSDLAESQAAGISFMSDHSCVVTASLSVWDFLWFTESRTAMLFSQSASLLS